MFGIFFVLLDSLVISSGIFPLLCSTRTSLGRTAEMQAECEMPLGFLAPVNEPDGQPVEQEAVEFPALKHEPA